MSLMDRIGSLTKKSRAPSQKITEPDVLAALKAVIDPDLHQDIVTLGFVRNLKIASTADGLATVAFDVNLTTPACPVKAELKSQCEEVVAKLPGVAKVDVNMTAVPNRERVVPHQIAGLAKVANVIAIASGKGGVGKSTVTVNLAYGLAEKGAKVGILDADVYGPSIPKMVRVTDYPVHGQGEKGQSAGMAPATAGKVKVISLGMFSQAQDAAILRGPMAGNVVKQFLTQVDWGELDYLLIDYPPGTGDIQLTISQTVPLAGAVLVTTPQEVAVIDVRKAMSMFKTLKVPVIGVIETMSYFVCDGCDKKHFIFAKGGGERLARENGIAFLGGVPLDPSVPQMSDHNDVPIIKTPDSIFSHAFQEATGILARQVSLLNAGQDGSLEQFTLIWK